MEIEVTFNDGAMHTLFEGDGITTVNLHRAGLLKLPETTDVTVKPSPLQPDISKTRLHMFLNLGLTIWYRFRFNTEQPLKANHGELFAYGHLILVNAITNGSNAVDPRLQVHATLMFRDLSETGLLSLSDNEIARRPHEMASA